MTLPRPRHSPASAARLRLLVTPVIPTLVPRRAAHAQQQPLARSWGNRVRWGFAVAAVLLAVARPAPAWAHGGLRASVPAANARLVAPPTVLRLTFSEAPELAVTTVTLLGADGRPVALGAIARAPEDRMTVTAAVPRRLAAGQYTVRWQMAGADGHPVRGRFVFAVAGVGAAGAPAAGALSGPAHDAPPNTSGAAAEGGAGTSSAAEGGAGVEAAAATDADAPSFDASSPAYVAVRWLTYVALLVIIGAAAFRWLVLATVERTRAVPAGEVTVLERTAPRAARLGAIASVGLLVAAVLRLAAQAVALAGGTEGAFDTATLVSIIGSTLWGWGWLLQVAAALTAWAGFRAAARAGSGRGAGRAGWTVAALGATAAAFTPALAGHAASVPHLVVLTVLADGLHVLGAGGWLGSLLVLTAVGVPLALAAPAPERGPLVADLVNAFSPTALAFSGTVAATGVFAAWMHLGSIPLLWQSDYGRLLLLKLGVLALVAGTGAYNWLRVRPALGDEVGGRRVRRSSTFELGVGLVVLLVTAVLVATPTGMEAMQGPAPTATVAPATTHG